MRIPRTTLLVIALFACAQPVTTRGPPLIAPEGPPPLEDRYVDGSAHEPGDGSREHPWSSLGDALNHPPSHLHLAPGIYSGVFGVAPGFWVEGTSPVVLTSDQDVAVSMRERSRLSNVTVQGGQTGISAANGVTLERVSLSGQRRGAIYVDARDVTIDHCELHATVSETIGIEARPFARLTVRNGRFEGPFKRAIESRSETLDVSQSTFVDAVTAVWQSGGAARLADLRIERGRGPGIFMAEGKLALRAVVVQGHEFGLQARKATLDVSDFSSSGAERAGIALVGGTAQLVDIRVERSGDFGALQTVGTDYSLRRFTFSSLTAYGISSRDGHAAIADGVIVDVRDTDGDLGDGLSLRSGHATVGNVVVRNAAGSCAVAAEGIEARLTTLELERCRVAGLIVDYAAHVDASSLIVRRAMGPAIVIPNSGTLKLVGLSSEKNEGGVIQANCAEGAHARIEGLKTDQPWTLSPCVDR